MNREHDCTRVVRTERGEVWVSGSTEAVECNLEFINEHVRGHGCRKRMARELEILHLERDGERIRSQALIEILSRIHGLLYPAVVEIAGESFQFTPKDPNAWAQRISDKIRQIPSEILAATGVTNIEEPRV